MYSKQFLVISTLCQSLHLDGPRGEGGDGPHEGKFTKLGEKVKFGVLCSKINIIRANKPLFDE